MSQSCATYANDPDYTDINIYIHTDRQTRHKQTHRNTHTNRQTHRHTHTLTHSFTRTTTIALTMCVSMVHATSLLLSASHKICATQVNFDDFLFFFHFVSKFCAAYFSFSIFRSFILLVVSLFFLISFYFIYSHLTPNLAVCNESVGCVQTPFPDDYCDDFDICTNVKNKISSELEVNSD